MMERVWDVVVVGAGPAGSCAALAALRESPAARVLLLDRHDFPRDKACGDGIASQAVDVLDRLGAGDVVDAWEPVRTLDLSRGGHRVEGRMRRPTWVVPRASFDAALVDHAVRAGAQLMRQRVRSVQVTGDGVVLDGDLRARAVVAADGAGSEVRASLCLTSHTRRAIALRGYAPTPREREGRQVIRYGERRQPSYAWAFDRGDGWSNVGYGELVDPSASLHRELFLRELERLIPGSTDGSRAWRAHHLPLSGWGWGREQPDGPVLLAGDAAGLVNPLTGEGIYYAVATGELAGRAAARGVAAGQAGGAGATYRRSVRALLGRHLQHTHLAATLGRRARVIDAGIAAAGRDARVFDAIVDLGLGDGLLTPAVVGGLTRSLVTRRRPQTDPRDWAG